MFLLVTSWAFEKNNEHKKPSNIHKWAILDLVTECVLGSQTDLGKNASSPYNCVNLGNISLSIHSYPKAIIQFWLTESFEQTIKCLAQCLAQEVLNKSLPHSPLTAYNMRYFLAWIRFNRQITTCPRCRSFGRYIRTLWLNAHYERLGFLKPWVPPVPKSTQVWVSPGPLHAPWAPYSASQSKCKSSGRYCLSWVTQSFFSDPGILCLLMHLWNCEICLLENRVKSQYLTGLDAHHCNWCGG